MKHVRLGIVGLGNIGKFHTSYLLDKEVSRCELTAVADPFAPNLEVFKDKVKTFEKNEDLIRSGEIDAIVVATPHFLHTTNFPFSSMIAPRSPRTARR